METSSTTPSQSQRIDESINSVVKSGQIPVVMELPKPVDKKIKKALKIKTHRSQRSIHDHTSDKHLRIRRGKRIFELYKRNPILLNKAQSRRHTDNIHRNRCWETITKCINKEYGKPLHPITVLKAKKLVEYWKGRCLNYTDPSIPLKVAIGSNTVPVTPPTDVYPTPPETPQNEELINLKTERDAKPRQVDLLRVDRLNFLISAAKGAMKATGLDREYKSRAHETNRRRNIIWEHLTVLLNRKYGKDLEIMFVDQVKKAFSNYKRRHPEEFEIAEFGDDEDNEQESAGGETFETIQDAEEDISEEETSYEPMVLDEPASSEAIAPQVSMDGLEEIIAYTYAQQLPGLISMKI